MNAPQTRPVHSRKVLQWLIPAGILTLPASCIYMQITARNEANAFCAQAIIGAPLAPLEKEAAMTGVKILRRISADRISVGFVGIPPFSRYLCTINARDGLITDASVTHID